MTAGAQSDESGADIPLPGMSRVVRSRAVTIWQAMLLVSTVAVTAFVLRDGLPPPGVLPLFGVLLLSGAGIRLLPTPSANSARALGIAATCMVAGAFLLPAALLPFLALTILVPDLWGEREVRRSWFTRATSAIIATTATGVVLRTTGLALRPLERPQDAVVLLAGVAIFAVVLRLLAAITAAVHSAEPLRGFNGRDIFLNNGLFVLFGAVVAGAWYTAPPLLAFVLPCLLLVQYVSRTANLAMLAHVDEKTGLYNARYLEQSLRKEIQHSTRTRSTVAVLFADIDHFKAINDRYGHSAGDDVLREVAQVLTGALRKTDRVARFGGEEFVVVLPNTDSDAALAAAEHVRAAIAQHTFTLSTGEHLHCTVSIGVAWTQDAVSDVPTLIAHADRAMYTAKQQGGNAVVQSEIETPAEVSASPSARPDWVRWFTTTEPQRRVWLARAILWGTVIAGVAGGIISAVLMAHTNDWLVLLVCTVCAIGAVLLPIPLYEANGEKLTATLTVTVNMAVIAIQPFAAPLVSFAAALVHVLVRKQRRADKIAFNLTSPTLASACAGWIYAVLHPRLGDFSPGHIAVALLSVGVYYLINVGTVSAMVSLHSARPLVRVLRDSLWYLVIFVLLGLSGAFIGAVYTKIGVVGTIIFSLPILLLWYTLGFAARKSKDAIETLEASKAAVEAAHTQTEATLTQLIETVSSIIDARDNLVWGHSRNVAQYSVLIGKELGLTAEMLDAVHTAGLLHDLGKIAIPESVLHKPSTLTTEEYEVVKQHPTTGERILAEVAPLAVVSHMVGDHHERWDGSGYPLGKQGQAITIGGRILAVADTLDTILSDRLYSPPRPLSWAIAEIDRCAGVQFDPAVVAALHRVIAAQGSAFLHGSALESVERHGQIVSLTRAQRPTTAVGG